jgi:hypothetical protein
MVSRRPSAIAPMNQPKQTEKTRHFSWASASGGEPGTRSLPWFLLTVFLCAIALLLLALAYMA